MWLKTVNLEIEIGDGLCSTIKIHNANFAYVCASSIW